VCRGRVLAVDLGRTRVGVLGGIGISLIGDFRSVEPLHNQSSFFHSALQNFGIIVVNISLHSMSHSPKLRNGACLYYLLSFWHFAFRPFMISHVAKSYCEAPSPCRNFAFRDFAISQFL
jgi:hypothetical protein